MTEPQTKAGRALLLHWDDTDGGYAQDNGLLEDILAIEAEAAGSLVALREVAEAARKVMDYPRGERDLYATNTLRDALARLTPEAGPTITLQCGWCGNVFPHNCPDALTPEAGQ